MDNAQTLPPPIACHLTALTDRTRYDTLRNLLRSAICGRAELPDGFALSLDGNVISLPELGEWIGMERNCCPFLTFDLSVSGSIAIWWLTLTGPDGAKPLLEREFPNE